jgi:hypothetical protein
MTSHTWDTWRPVGVCPTEYSHDADGVRFSVRCSLDAGHGGFHRGTATVEFSPLILPVTDKQRHPQQETL